MSRSVLNVYKEKGETPLACLKRLQLAFPELADKPLTYAGRLDPLAEGVLVVLVGEEARRKEAYLALKKRYRFQVLFGFSTDTYDVAGLLTAALNARVPIIELMELVRTLPGSWDEPYPPYASKPVDGKPLFQWAREGRLGEIIMPVHTVTVYQSVLRHCETLQGLDIHDVVTKNLGMLKGDFRQTEILASWSEALQGREETLYDVATIEIECAQGTYVRSIAHALGGALNLPALAWSIV